MSTIAQG